MCVQIFEHDFYADKEKVRRNTGVLQGLLTKFSMKICQKDVRRKILNRLLENIRELIYLNTTTTTEITETITETIVSSAEEASEITSYATIQQQVDRTANIIEKALNHFRHAVPSILMAIGIFIIGILISRIISKLIMRPLKKSNIDGAARGFLMSLIRIILYTIVVIMSLTVLNVPMSSIITIFGAAGLAVSLALQNCLSNLAGGFIILFSKPFSAGDIIELDGSVGKVKSISILYTKIETFDGKIVSIPNGKVSEAKIINYTESPDRRIELKFDISYDADFRIARELILGIIKAEKLIHTIPEPIVRMTSQNNSSVSIDVFVWVSNNDYAEIRYRLIEAVKEVFDENGIEIPYNQLDLHIKEKINGKDQ